MIRPTEEEAEYNVIIAALTPKQVRAVTFIRMGYTKAEIARKMGVSRASVTRLFYRLQDCAEK